MSRRNDRDDDHDDDDDIEAAAAAASSSQYYYSRCPDLFPNLYFRSVQPTDRQQIQALHEDWFPVVYQDEFYDALVYGRLTAAAEEYHDSRNSSSSACCHLEGEEEEESNHHWKDDMENENGTAARRKAAPPPPPRRSKPLITYLAVEDCSNKNNCRGPPGQTRMSNPYSLTNGTNEVNQKIRNPSQKGNVIVEEQYDMTSCSHCQSHSSQQTHDNERIVACVVGAFVEHTILSEELQTMLIPDTTQHTRLFYIMTLGTVADYRRTGLASHLVQQCCRAAAAVPECGTLYLHVLDTNEAAIRFYEKLGFYRVKLIPNYYSIHGRPRHCYLYAKYLNGNRGHLTIVTRLKRVIQIVWRQLTSPLSLWAIDQPSKTTEFVASHGQNETAEV